MTIKWTNLMKTTMIMMSLLNANMLFNKNFKKPKKMNKKNKKPNWKL